MLEGRVKWVIFIPLKLSSDGASPRWIDLLSVKDGSFDAPLGALASGIGVIEDKPSMRHQFWNIVWYKFRSQMCVFIYSIHVCVRHVRSGICLKRFEHIT